MWVILRKIDVMVLNERYVLFDSCCVSKHRFVNLQVESVQGKIEIGVPVGPCH